MKDSALRFDITLVTHQGLPQGAQDDQLLAAALRLAGCSVRLAVWDDPGVDWADSRLTLLRSTWDYHLKPRAWLAWLDRIGSQTQLINPPPLVGWNTDKRYLRDLALRGAPCLPTVFIEGDALPSLASVLAEQGWRDVVVKPAIGASARGARRFRGDEIAQAGEQHLRLLAPDGAVLVQPFMPVVEQAEERCLVFIEGRYSHAFAKPAFSGGAAGHAAIRLHEATAIELDVARQVLAAAPGPASYARVDLIPGVDGPMLMELELIEPDMALRLAPQAVERLSAACIALLG